MFRIRIKIRIKIRIRIRIRILVKHSFKTLIIQMVNLAITDLRGPYGPLPYEGASRLLID